MSIDFDSAAFQTQPEEEEEYDQEDYAREQELHKLLTDLPDDMLEDSHDSSPELDYSTCSPQRDDDRLQHTWNAQPEWSNQSHPSSSEEGQTDHLIDGWDTHESQNYQYNNNFSAEEGYEHKAYPQAVSHFQADYNQVEVTENDHAYEEHANIRNHFQNFDNQTTENKDVNCYKASYQPYKTATQPKMFNVQSSHPNDHFEQLQRDFLDSTPVTVDVQECAQLKILNKAQSRQIEDLEQKLEDSRRKVRYLEHQFAIVKDYISLKESQSDLMALCKPFIQNKDEKEGLTLSMKESSHLIEEAKEKESQLQSSVRSLEQQIQTLAERDQENMKKQHAAEAAVDSMQKQVMELCRSDTLTRAREQHDRDMAAIREQHDAHVLMLQQKLDSHTQSLEEQVQLAQRLSEQVRKLERQREEEQVDRAAVINALTQRLEESQQQCAKLLQTGSVQEMSQMQFKLQQAQSCRNISDNMNKALQEELMELKEQITLYESAVKLGAIPFDSNPDLENQLSESYMDLGIKKVYWKNGRNHSTPALSDSSEPKEDFVKELKIELKRCLGQLKLKRDRIFQLQEELRTSHSRVEQLQNQLQDAERTAKDSVVRENSLEKLLEQTNKAPHKELVRLEEQRQHLQKRVEALEVQNKELKHSEEKVKAANSELCTKMREMIQELDQEKQEAAARYERTQQQYRDDVVQRVRAELTQEHKTYVEQLSSEHQEQIQLLESKLCDLSQEVLAVQECYISVCKEKDQLEEKLQSRIDHEKKLQVEEQRRTREAELALEKQKSDLTIHHQEAVALLKEQWTKEKETEIQMHITSTTKSCKEELQEMEKTWAHKLEEAIKKQQKAQATETQEGSCQTVSPESAAHFVFQEQTDRLCAQRAALQRETDNKLAKAVEEAVRQREQELLQQHVKNITMQVEDAVSRAQACWLVDLTSLPEYKSSLQIEREQWEKLQQQHTQEQVSLAIKSVENKWQETLGDKNGELEDCLSRNRELKEQVHSLSAKLERQQTEFLKAELSAARAMWNTDKQEEISCLRIQFQREQQSQQDKHQAQLEKSIKETQEKVLRQSQADLHDTLQKKELDWRSQQELRLQQGKEEVLAELKEVLKEVQERRVVSEEQGRKEGEIRATLRDLCKEMLSEAVANVKQQWVKSSEDKWKHVLQEAQEQHVKELNNIHTQTKESLCNTKSCTETIGRLQKKSQELQRHLEKACRQLQHSVREHKRTLNKLKEREAQAKALEEVKRAACKESSDAVNQHHLQAGLEEMKEQYMKAVQKIKGDMLRYLQESKERAAELIRVEVLRERQDTARRMRRYYLTCLQELLEEGGQTTGAEKKIINAASKLAAMANVLETPVAKKKLQRNPHFQETSNPESSEPNNAAQVPGAASSQTLCAIVDANEDCKNEQSRQMHSLTESSYLSQPTKMKGSKSADKNFQSDFKSVRANDAKGPEMTKVCFSTVSVHSHNPKPPVSIVHNSASNVTLRKQSREMYLTGTEAGKASERLSPQEAVEPFLIEEAPVRDDSQSDWSLSSSSSTFTNTVQLSSTYPSKNADPLNSLSRMGPAVENLDFRSTLGDNSDVTVYKEIVKKPSAFRMTKMTKRREPIPGSEAKSDRLCPESLLSEFKKCQQDSGFDSLLSLIHK